MKTGNLVRVKAIPNEDAAGNPIEEAKGVYLGEEKVYDTIVYDVLILGQSQVHQLSSNFWELEKL